MLRKGFKTIIALSFFFVFSAFLSAGKSYKLVNGQKDFYFGHISLTDIRNDGQDAQILRAGKASTELATLNLPLGPGDTIMTFGERRLEIQFDNGTIVRLDRNTELKIETILAQSLSSGQKLSNLVLRRGQIYTMYKQYDAEETFQVITANAAVKFKHNTVATIGLREEGTTDVQVKTGKAAVRYGPDADHPKDRIVGKGEAFSVLPDHTFALGEYAVATEFEAWNSGINENFEALHEGQSELPKPVQRLSRAVFYFAQMYSNTYGEWLWDDYLGYVWRPFYNDYYPWGNWSPYIYGRWLNYSSQMFWVPDEPWGWVPYHLGVWHWDKNKGWLWIPGSAFAPAWVDWMFFGGGYFCWRPLGPWDWIWYGNYDYFAWMDYSLDPFYSWQYLGGLSGNVYGGNVVGDIGSGGQKHMLTVVYKNQLKKPSAPPYAMPNELKKAYRSLLAALKKGDASASESFVSVSKQAVVVTSRDLNSARIQEKAVKLEPFLKTAALMTSGGIQKMLMETPPASASQSLRAAAQVFDRNARATALGRDLDSGALSGDLSPLPSARVLQGAMKAKIYATPTRTFDWNPDVRIGRLLHVDIQYSSGRNEVYCPQLGITSRMAESRPVLSAAGIRTAQAGRPSWEGGSSTSPGAGFSASSGGGESGGSSSVSASGGSASTSSGSASSGSGGGHIKKK
jgi:hypothetical protein